MADEGTLVLTFDEILAGAAGPKEAAAAKRWLDAGAPVQPLPSRLVALDPHGFDMRVAGGHARKRLPAVDLLPDSPAEVKLEPVKEAKPAATASLQQQPTPAQRPQQVQQPQTQQQNRAAAVSGSTGLFSKAALSGNASASFLAARRKGSGPVEFVLPAGWRHLPAVASGSPGGGASGKAAKSGKAAAAGKRQPAKQAQPQQSQQQAAFLSPEGLPFSSLPDVQAVVEGPVIVPRKLVRWLRQAAANPLHPMALQAPNTTIGRAHLLAARRARVATHAADRQQWERRLVVVAGEQTSAERRLRRRSND